MADDLAGQRVRALQSGGSSKFATHLRNLRVGNRDEYDVGGIKESLQRRKRDGTGALRRPAGRRLGATGIARDAHPASMQVQSQGEPDFPGSHEPHAYARVTFCRARTIRAGHLRAFRFMLRGWMPRRFRVTRAPFGCEVYGLPHARRKGGASSIRN